jgi:hypothetical protein
MEHVLAHEGRAVLVDHELYGWKPRHMRGDLFDYGKWTKRGVEEVIVFGVRSGAESDVP